jgi:hypothetical protein
MSIFNLEILKEKPTKSKIIVPHLKLSKKSFYDKEIEKKQKLQLIWTYKNMVKF